MLINLLATGSVVITLCVQMLNIVIINLKSGVATTPSKPNHVVIVVVYFHANLAQRQVVGAHIEYNEYISFHLKFMEIYMKTF